MSHNTTSVTPKQAAAPRTRRKAARLPWYLEAIAEAFEPLKKDLGRSIRSHVREGNGYPRLVQAIVATIGKMAQAKATMHATSFDSPAIQPAEHADFVGEVEVLAWPMSQPERNLIAEIMTGFLEGDIGQYELARHLKKIRRRIGEMPSAMRPEREEVHRLVDRVGDDRLASIHNLLTFKHGDDEM